jgi:hypothetical protein
VGAIVGVIVYGASKLTGPGVYILAGATGGVVAAIVMQAYSQTVRLTDITVSVPQFSELHFAVTRDSQEVAWKLFVESVTRVSVQSLESGNGILREALTSLYSLFETTREILKQTQPSRKTGDFPTVEHLAIAMLNNELRPFLSRWHPVLRDWENQNPGKPNASWPLAAECRADLVAMQRRLMQYVLGFGRLAGVPNSREVLEGSMGDQFWS